MNVVGSSRDRIDDEERLIWMVLNAQSGSESDIWNLLSSPIYTRRARSICMYLVSKYRVSSFYGVEDLYQDLSIKILLYFRRGGGLGIFEDIKGFHSWLHVVARHILFDSMRKFKGESKLAVSSSDDSFADEIIHEPSYSPSPDIQYGLKMAIKSLNDLDQAILTMHLSGFLLEEIASRTGSSRSAVHRHLKSALKLIRDNILA